MQLAIFIFNYALLISTFCNGCFGKSNRRDMNLLSTYKDSLNHNKGMFLTNESNEKISLSYLNYFSDRIQINLNPKQSKFINSDFPIWVFDQNINHRNNYLLVPGDTLQLNFNSTGDIQIKAKQTSRNNDLNVFINLNKNNSKELYKLSFDRTYNSIESKLNTLNLVYNRKYSSDRNIVDSLIKSNLISKNFATCLKTVVYLDHLSRLFIGVWNNKSLSKLINKDAKGFDTLYKRIISSSYQNVCSPLMYKNIIYSYFVRHAQFRLEKDPFLSGSYTKPDSDTLYHIAQEEFKSNEYILNKILFLIVKEEILSFPNSKKECITDFLTNNTDSQYVNYIKDLQRNKIEIQPREHDDIVVNSSGQNNYFSEIIKRNRGKVIYLDIWASWCVPCRKEFPYSTRLRERFKDKEVSFIFLSIDNNTILWKKALYEESLSNYSNCYIIPKYDSSILKKSLGLTGIPRYILFDKNGKIYNANAARPSEETEVTNQINRLLN